MLNNDHESFAAAQARAAAAVSCESVVLPSGLTVLCRTMPGYSSVHAIYATGFGSVHRAFKLDGKQVTLPRRYGAFPGAQNVRDAQGRLLHLLRQDRRVGQRLYQL